MTLAESEPKQENKLIVHILDKSKDKGVVVDRCSEKLELSPISIVQNREYWQDKFYENIHEYMIPLPYRWLAGFRDAEFVVTDSFHGVVFSIIFNKPFVAIMNRGRGGARFDSLLRMFGLEDRIIEDSSQLVDAHYAPIDYERINAIKKQWQERSIEFLHNIR